MSYKTGKCFFTNIKLNGSTANCTYTEFPYHAEYAKPWVFGDYGTFDIPAVGSSYTGDQIDQREGPENMGQIVMPVNARLVGAAYQIKLNNPPDGAGHMRFAVMEAVFDNSETSVNGDATWKTLGRWDTTDISGIADATAMLQIGHHTFTSSDGDVDAGQVCGLVYQAWEGASGDGDGMGLFWGAVTLMWEAR